MRPRSKSERHDPPWLVGEAVLGEETIIAVLDIPRVESEPKGLGITRGADHSVQVSSKNRVLPRR